MKNITIKPIGTAKNDIEEPMFGSWENIISEIALEKKFSETLDGIEEYSHIIVVYWMDQVGGYKIKHRPQGNTAVPIVGIFACRCPARPNPIGITVAQLIERRGNIIKVKGLDTIDGTPILDIKPYTPAYDTPKGEVKVPTWVNKLKY